MCSAREENDQCILQLLVAGKFQISEGGDKIKTIFDRRQCPLDVANVDRKGIERRRGAGEE